MKLKIKITKEILEKSKNCPSGKFSSESKSTGSNCYVALTIRDIFPRALVGEFHIYPFYWEGVDDFMIKLPKETRRLIRVFDSLSPEDRVKLDEFDFEIDIPEEVIEKINIQEITSILQNHPTLQLI